jgi:hypothetical protein
VQAPKLSSSSSSSCSYFYFYYYCYYNCYYYCYYYSIQDYECHTCPSHHPIPVSTSGCLQKPTHAHRATKGCRKGKGANITNLFVSARQFRTRIGRSHRVLLRTPQPALQRLHVAPQRRLALRRLLRGARTCPQLRRCGSKQSLSSRLSSWCAESAYGFGYGLETHQGERTSGSHAQPELLHH